MKENNDYLKCSRINSLLLQYGFVEKIVSVNGKKRDDKCYLYLQLKPRIGLLVYNYCRMDSKKGYQGFDFFMYNTHNFEVAIFLNQHAKKMCPSSLLMLGIHEQLNRFESVMDQLIEEENSDFRVVMSKYKTSFDKQPF